MTEGQETGLPRIHSLFCGFFASVCFQWKDTRTVSSFLFKKNKLFLSGQRGQNVSHFVSRFPLGRGDSQERHHAVVKWDRSFLKPANDNAMRLFLKWDEASCCETWLYVLSWNRKICLSLQSRSTICTETIHIMRLPSSYIIYGLYVMHIDTTSLWKMINITHH